MASLTGFASKQAKDTSKSNIRIGFCAQVVLRAGIVPRYAKALEKPKCFQEYAADESADDTKVKCMENTKRITGEDHSDYFPCLWIEVVPDTSLTPASRYRGSFLSLETPTQKNPRTLKEHGRFALHYMSPELDELVGKKVWVHIAWQRLTEEFGGDLTLLGDDANDELSVIISLLKNKREATELVKQLREQVVDTDSLCLARGYPVQETRDAIRAAAASGKDDKGSVAKIPLTKLGAKTEQNYVTMEGFLDEKTIEFLKKNYEKADGDIALVSANCGADMGDIAIALNKPEYFRTLMAETGLGEQEALVKVVELTGIANGADLADFLQIEESPF